MVIMATVFDTMAKDIMTPLSKLKTIQKNEKLSAAIGLLTEEEIHNVVVLDGKRYEGIFGHQQLVRLQNVPPASAKVEHFLFRPSKINPEAPLVDIAETMFKNNCRIIPIIKDEQLLGVVSESDVVNAAAKIGELRGKKVRDVMTPDPYCVKEKDEIATALAIMRDFRVSRLPVLSRENRVIGLLESSDAIRRIVTKETPESRMHYYGYSSAPGVTERLPVYKAPVRELMKSRPILARAEDALEEKLAEVARLNESTIIVVDENQAPLGVVAPRDIIEHIASLKKPSGIYMQISGWDPGLVGDFAEAQLHRMIEETVRKISSVVKIRNFTLHFKTYHEMHDRLRFSLRARVLTDYGLFVTAEHGYDIIAVANVLFDRIERGVMEHEQRHRAITRKQERRTKLRRFGAVLPKGPKVPRRGPRKYD